MKNKKNGFIVIGFLISYVSLAQKHDYIWLTGYNSAYGLDTPSGIRYGTSTINFNSGSPVVNYDTLQMNFQETNTTFSDSDGNLLFYTNGIYVANKWNEKIEGGDSLNGGFIPYVLYPAAQTYGYFNAQGIIVIPIPNKTNEFALLHAWEDTFNNGLICKRLLYTHLDMAQNNGHGKVLKKNEVVINSLIGSEVVATKHANGRDWWILTQKRGTNCYFRTLVDSAGPHLLPDLTCGGQTTPLNDDGAAQFAPDGNKFAYYQIFSGVSVFDFDRCTGQLANAQHLDVPAIADSGWYPLGCSFSPNSRFLYLSAVLYMYQIDLADTNIFAHIDTVARFDQSELDGQLICGQQLGPDGKIYINSGGADTAFSVINYPDIKGVACDVQRGGLRLKSLCLSVPNYPNYRLSSLDPTMCNSTGTLTKAEGYNSLIIYPNPGSGVFFIEYSGLAAEGESLNLGVFNAIGEKVYAQKLPPYNSKQGINLQFLPDGIYLVMITNGGNQVGMTKLCKQ